MPWGEWGVDAFLEPSAGKPREWQLLSPAQEQSRLRKKKSHWDSWVKNSFLSFYFPSQFGRKFLTIPNWPLSPNISRFCLKDRHPLLSSKITLRITSSAWKNLTTMGVPIFWILRREIHLRIVIRNLECTSTLKPTGIMHKVRSFPLQRACLRT